MNTPDKCKAIAYVDLAILAIGLVMVSILGLVFAFEYDPDGAKGKDVQILFVGLMIRFVIGANLQLAGIILLLEGVMLRSHKRCAAWIITTKVFLALLLISAIVIIFLNPISVVLELLAIGYKIFCLRIVGTYAIELQNDSVFHP